MHDIRFRWDGDFVDGGNLADITGSVNNRVFVNVPASTDQIFANEDGPQFTAHPAFVAGVQPLASQGIKPRRSGLRITLDEADYPKGQYEFKVVRGAMMDLGALDGDYKNNGYVPDLFNFTGSNDD